MGESSIRIYGGASEASEAGSTHHLGMNLYVNFLGPLDRNGFQLK